MIRRLASGLVAFALVACGNSPDTKVSDLCAPEGSVCEDGTVCSDGACVPCKADDQCGGLLCLAGRCRACTESAQCGPGRVCLGGLCAGCTKSLDCPLEQACVEGACVPCASSGDCGDGRACVEGACRACERSTQCDGGKVCAAGVCSACTETRECEGGLACVAGSCSPCTDASQCLEGDVCLGGKCGPCTSRSQCLDGTVCVQGHCAPCGTSEDCERGEACVAGRCGRCRSADDCSAGEVCRDGVCGRCGTSAECSGGKVCVSGACVACSTRAQCEEGLVCVEGACRACNERAECNRGEICRDGRCGPCGSANDCAAGEICVGGACGPCSDRTQCPVAGQVCVQGSCRACAGEFECTPGEACSGGRCKPCASADECEAGKGCIAARCGPCSASADCRLGEVCRPSTRTCGPAGQPDHLELVSGQSQRATVQTRLAQDLVVRVVDAARDPVPGVVIAFDPAASGFGTAGAATVTSGPDGLASTTWLLGPLAGSQFLTVRRAGTALPDAAQSGRAALTFTATADADVPDRIELVTGDAQTVAAGTAAPVRLQVRVTDRWGNGLPQVPLTWTQAQGTGTLDLAAGTRTDADGRAFATLTLARAPALHEVVVGRTGAELPDVDVTGRKTATFRITGVAGPADHLAKVSGDGQSGAILATLAAPLVVRAVDRYENPVTGQALRVTGSTGVNLVVTPTALTTGPQGTASVAVKLGSQAGAQTLSIFASPALPDLAQTGRASVTFDLTVTPGAPDHLELVAGDGQTAVAGTKLPVSPSVRVVDQVGNRLAGVAVSFATTDGAVSNAKVTTGPDGGASTDWTLGLANGPQAMTAARDGAALPGVTGPATITFAATAPQPTVNSTSPDWLPVAGGRLTVTGTNFASDASVTVAGLAATIVTRSATELVVAAPSLVPYPAKRAGNQPVSVTSAGTTVDAGPLFYALKLSPVVDGGVLQGAGDWPPQALVASNLDAGGQYVGSAWGGNELRDLYMGYDDQFVYVGVVGYAQKQNAIVGYVYQDGLTAQSRPSASGDVRLLTDGLGNGQGDGNGCFWQEPNCANNGKALSLDDMISAGFHVTVPGWVAHYAFGRTGNAADVATLGVANAAGVRNLANRGDFGWSASIVRRSATAQEWAIPWSTFDRDTIGVNPDGSARLRPITRIQAFVRIVADAGQQWPNQGLPSDANSIASSGTVSSVATLEVR
jgi:hypothetical protein